MQENGNEEELELDQPSPAAAPMGVDPTQLVTVKVPLSSVPNMNRPHPQRFTAVPPRKAAEASSKEFLEELMLNPESMNYQLAIHRYAPAYDDNGEEIRRGILMTVPVMPLDALNAEIASSWGGGSYKAAVVDGSGTPIINERFKCVVLVNIPITQCKPKNNRNEKSVTALATPVSQSMDGDANKRIQEIRMQEQIADLEARAEEKELARQNRRLALEKERRLLQQAEAPSSALEKELIELRRQQSEERNQFMTALKDMQSNFTTALKDLNFKIENVQRDKEGNNQQNFMLAMTDSTNKLLGALLPALTQKKDTSDTDKILENQRYMTELVLKVGQKDSARETQLIQSLLNSAISNKDQYGPEFMLKLMDMGEKRLRSALELVRDQGGDEDPIVNALGEAAGKAEAGWVGVLQNLVSNPALAPILSPLIGGLAQKVFGTQQPQRQDFNRATQGLRPVQGTMVPNIPPMLPVGQFQTPALPNQQMPPVPQQQFVPQQPQQFPAHMQSQPQTFSTPTTPSPQAANQPVSPPEQSGPTPGVTEPNPIAQAAGHQDVPMDQQMQLDGEETEDDGDDEVDPTLSSDPAVRLKFYVTESMKIALRDIQDKRQAREWMQDAFSYWSKDFLTAISQGTRDDGIGLVAANCEEEVWNQLYQVLAGNPNEYTQFLAQFDFLRNHIAETLKKEQTLQAQGAASHQPTPVPAQTEKPAINSTQSVAADPNQAAQSELAAAQ